MNNQERIYQFKQIQHFINQYDFNDSPLYWGDDENKKPLYLDDEDIYYKIIVALKRSNLKLKQTNKGQND